MRGGAVAIGSPRAGRRLEPPAAWLDHTTHRAGDASSTCGRSAPFAARPVLFVTPEAGRGRENRMVSTKELVSKLNAARAERRLTCQDIVAITEQNGEPVSLSTVRRVFADDPGSCDFRLDNTLGPIARALGVSLAEPGEPAQEGEDEMQAALAMLKETYEARVADLWATIRLLRRDKLVMVAVIIILLLFVFYLFADGLHGDWGFFRYPEA